MDDHILWLCHRYFYGPPSRDYSFVDSILSLDKFTPERLIYDSIKFKYPVEATMETLGGTDAKQSTQKTYSVGAIYDSVESQYQTLAPAASLSKKFSNYNAYYNAYKLVSPKLQKMFTIELFNYIAFCPYMFYSTDTDSDSLIAFVEVLRTHPNMVTTNLKAYIESFTPFLI